MPSSLLFRPSHSIFLFLQSLRPQLKVSPRHHRRIGGRDTKVFTRVEVVSIIVAEIRISPRGHKILCTIIPLGRLVVKGANRFRCMINGGSTTIQIISIGMAMTPQVAKDPETPTPKVRVKGRAMERGVPKEGGKARAPMPSRTQIFPRVIPHRQGTPQGPPLVTNPPSQQDPNRGAKVPGRG